MSWLQPIHGDGFLATIDVESEVLSAQATTRYGPLYGGCMGLRTLLAQTKTCIQVYRASLT